MRSSAHQSGTRDPRWRADEELLELASGGDAQAFEVVFGRHVDAAFSLAYRVSGSHAMAEDVVQEAFVSIWRSGARYDRARGSVRTWILRVVHNRAIDLLRRDVSRQGRDVHDDESLERVGSAEDSLDAEVQRRDDALRVRSALKELPADQRGVIELAYFGGFTHSQIGEMLGLPNGTVKGRMRLGLGKLRLNLGDPAEVER